MYLIEFSDHGSMQVKCKASLSAVSQMVSVDRLYFRRQRLPFVIVMLNTTLAQRKLNQGSVQRHSCGCLVLIISISLIRNTLSSHQQRVKKSQNLWHANISWVLHYIWPSLPLDNVVISKLGLISLQTVFRNSFFFCIVNKMWFSMSCKSVHCICNWHFIRYPT